MHGNSKVYISLKAGHESGELAARMSLQPDSLHALPLDKSNGYRQTFFNKECQASKRLAATSPTCSCALQ